MRFSERVHPTTCPKKHTKYDFDVSSYIRNSSSYRKIEHGLSSVAGWPFQLGFPRNGLLRLSQSQGPPQTGFYFCCASNVFIIMNLNFMCLVRLEHRDMHMQRKLIMIILSSWLRLAIRIGMFPRHGLSRLCIYAAQMQFLAREWSAPLSGLRPPFFSASHMFLSFISSR